MEPLVIDWAKEETKMRKLFGKFMFIANNAIFKLIVIIFSARSIAGVLPND